MARKQAGRSKASRRGARKKAVAGTRRPAKAKRAGSKKRPSTRRPAKKTAPKRAAARTTRKPAAPAAPKKARTTARKRVNTGAARGRAQAPSLERSRRRLPELEDNIPTPPSSLGLIDQPATAAGSGRRQASIARHQHTETSPELTGGDVDADWEDAYSVGDEAPGGDNPTPDQDRVDDIGRALGVEYQDNEELKGGDKISGRDRHRWELDPASAEDYNDRDEE